MTASIAEDAVGFRPDLASPESRTTVMNFDIDKYLGGVAALDDHDIDYAEFRTSPLDPDTLRCLLYMHDVEHHTVCYLRDLLVTQAHNDPAITSFLTMWAYEEFWHGEAIGKVLRAHDEPAGRARISALRNGLGRRAGGLSTMAASLLSRHIVTVSLSWGAVNEWTTQAAYMRLAARADHPTLTALVRRIAKQEGRHIDFYVSEATRRLDDSVAAQRITRMALSRRWAPVGSGIMPRSETDHLIRHLFAGAEGLQIAQRIDRRIDRMPGLSGLGLVEGARRRPMQAPV
jgi:hypothetical protein